MATSVPSVTPISEIRWRLGEAIEAAIKTGNPKLIREGLGLARRHIELEKIAVHEGRSTWAYVRAIEDAISKTEQALERAIERAKAKRATSFPESLREQEDDIEYGHIESGLEESKGLT